VASDRVLAASALRNSVRSSSALAASFRPHGRALLD